MRRLRKEEYLKKTENIDSARTWRLEGQWRVVESHSAAVCCCSRPMVGLLYKAVPVLADEDKIGGSAIYWVLDSNAIRYWSYQKLSGSSAAAPKAPLFLSESQRGTSQPLQRCLERRGGFPCTDLYPREVGTDRPLFSKCIARHGPTPCVHVPCREAPAPEPLWAPRSLAPVTAAE